MKAEEWQKWIAGQGGMSSTPKADIQALIADLAACEARCKALREAACDIRAYIAGGRLGSIGSLHNVYCAQIGVEAVKRLSDAIAASEGGET